MSVIFIFSSKESNESTKESSRVIDIIITITEKINNKKINSIEKEKIYRYLSYPVRKTAHVIVYLILGIIACNIVLLYKIDVKEIIIISVLFCMLYATSDEIHQLFVSGRSGKLIDVLLDTCSSTLGILFTYLVFPKNRKNCKN